MIKKNLLLLIAFVTTTLYLSANIVVDSKLVPYAWTPISDVDKVLVKAIRSKKAEFLNVFIKPNQKIIPKLAFGSPLEDLSPPLPRKEFLEDCLM